MKNGHFRWHFIGSFYSNKKNDIGSYIIGDDNYRICFDTFVKEQEERVAKNSERDN